MKQKLNPFDSMLFCVQKKEKKIRLRILEWQACLSSFYFLTGCLYADDDVAELFVLLLLLPQPFDAARIATVVFVAAAVERQRRAGISAEEGFAQVCSRQSQAETTLQRGEGESRPVKKFEGYQGQKRTTQKMKQKSQQYD